MNFSVFMKLTHIKKKKKECIFLNSSEVSHPDFMDYQIGDL